MLQGLLSVHAPLGSYRCDISSHDTLTRSERQNVLVKLSGVRKLVRRTSDIVRHPVLNTRRRFGRGLLAESNSVLIKPTKRHIGRNGTSTGHYGWEGLAAR